MGLQVGGVLEVLQPQLLGGEASPFFWGRKAEGAEG